MARRSNQNQRPKILTEDVEPRSYTPAEAAAEAERKAKSIEASRRPARPADEEGSALEDRFNSCLISMVQVMPKLKPRLTP